MGFLENIVLISGRVLLGLYFIIPGITKITGYDGTAAYMASHDVPFISFLLPLTIVIQIAAGIALVIGYKGKFAAFLLAGLTLVISVYMHNFWAFDSGVERSHETQNFIKNMAIMAGLLIVSSVGTGKMSVSNRRRTLFS